MEETSERERCNAGPCATMSRKRNGEEDKVGCCGCGCGDGWANDGAIRGKGSRHCMHIGFGALTSQSNIHCI